MVKNNINIDDFLFKLINIFNKELEVKSGVLYNQELKNKIDIY